MKKLIAVAMGVAMLSGCSVRVADLTLASTKNYNINGNNFVKGQRVVGNDQVPVVLFPLGVPNVKEAADRAIEKNKCAVALSDVVINNYAYAFLFGVTGINVEGNLVIDRSQPGCANATGI